MRLNDLKYLIAYVAPISAWLGFYFEGWWSPGSIYVAFIIIPLLELVLPVKQDNIQEKEESRKVNNMFFDIILWFNVPILFLLLVMYLNRVTSGDLNPGEQAGMLFNMGLIIGVCGINVGHELGHRSRQFERVIAWSLLLPALYLHFYIEHNRGHHRWVATDRDPASARKNEWVYTFWFRSIIWSWINAWKLEAARLKKMDRNSLSLSNQMIVFQFVQVCYLLVVYRIWGGQGLLFAIGAAIVGIILLETINYVEHYGLRRLKRKEGHFEKVQPWHSWNSDHQLGRIFLYELTRHSDHHYKASRKYQVLRHFKDSPQLPVGYPGSMIISLLPPLWMYIMNPRIDKECHSI